MSVVIQTSSRKSRSASNVTCLNTPNQLWRNLLHGNQLEYNLNGNDDKLYYKLTLWLPRMSRIEGHAAVV